MAGIHPTAVVDPRAVLADDVALGPYCVVEGEVEIGPGCVAGPYCRFEGPTRIAGGNRFTSHCSIGAPPQDIGYKGEPTRLEIGPNNLFREFCTVHRATTKQEWVTRVGANGMFMVGAHIGHDADVGDYVVFANNATLAGHVVVGNYAAISAFSAVHQFCRVGEHAFLGGFTVATKDALPFMKTVGGRPARCFGPNSVGLARRGFTAEQREAIKHAWRFLHHTKLTTHEAIARIETELAEFPDALRIVEYIKSSKRGVILSLG